MQQVKDMASPWMKNFWIVDLNHYKPVLVTANGDVVIEADFSLAEENIDSGDRLKLLIEFLGTAKRQLDDCAPGLTDLLTFGVSHRVAEQIAYLAYWKDYRLDFHIDKVKSGIVVWARFPNQSELNCVLDEFAGGFDLCDDLQGWWDFFCRLISELAEIWQIHLVVHECVRTRLAVVQPSNVLVDIQTGEDASLEELLTVPLRRKGIHR